MNKLELLKKEFELEVAKYKRERRAERLWKRRTAPHSGVWKRKNRR